MAQDPDHRFKSKFFGLFRGHQQHGRGPVHDLAGVARRNPAVFRLKGGFEFLQIFPETFGIIHRLGPKRFIFFRLILFPFPFKLKGNDMIVKPALALGFNRFLHAPHTELIQVLPRMTFIFGDHFSAHPLGNRHPGLL